jgi:peptidoglycan/LPS O-acetylase OafA/YrhL
VLLLLGTWALTVYLVHQPLLMGALALLKKLGL